MTEHAVGTSRIEIASAAQGASKGDIDGVTTAARDYIEGFIHGDADRHARAYHPECIKRRFATNEESGIDELREVSPRAMLDHAASVGSSLEGCESEIVVDAVSDGMASVRVYSCQWSTFSTSSRRAANGSFSTSRGTAEPARNLRCRIRTAARSTVS